MQETTQLRVFTRTQIKGITTSQRKHYYLLAISFVYNRQFYAHVIFQRSNIAQMTLMSIAYFVPLVYLWKISIIKVSLQPLNLHYFHIIIFEMQFNMIFFFFEQRFLLTYAI